jgi:hypothetical protein
MADNSSDPGGELSTDSSPTLTASTGKNDSSSIWGSGGILGAVTGLSNAAGTILKGVNGTPTAKKATTLPTWAIPAAIGGVLLLVVLLVVARK